MSLNLSLISTKYLYQRIHFINFLKHFWFFCAFYWNSLNFCSYKGEHTTAHFEETNVTLRQIPTTGQAKQSQHTTKVLYRNEHVKFLQILKSSTHTNSHKLLFSHHFIRIDETSLLISNFFCKAPGVTLKACTAINSLKYISAVPTEIHTFVGIGVITITIYCP